MNKGIVYLIGAGCGKKNLITLKGLEALRKSDVVVYDDLIDTDLIYEAKNAQCIYMGKRANMHSASQKEITDKLIELSLSGKTVARLKGGDPFVFGRTGEEIFELQKANIPFEVIPGISSSIAIPELSGISVTQRKISRGFMVVTGHTADENEDKELLDSILKFPGTIVILMGLGRIEEITSSLIKGGKNPKEKVAVISGGNSDNPILVKGTLSSISKKVKDEKVKTPAVIVIGKVVDIDLSDKSEFRTLRNIRVGINGTKHFSSKLENVLSEKGANVSSLLKTKVIENPNCKISNIIDEKNKWVILTSANGVRTFFNKIKEEEIDVRKLCKLKFGVIGNATKNELLEHGIKADLMPENYTSEDLGKLIVEKVSKEEEIILLRADDASVFLPTMLKKNGFNTKEYKLYFVEKEECKQKDISAFDYIVFSSSNTVKLFFDEYKNIANNVCVVAIGKITENTVRSFCNNKVITANKAEVESIVEVIERDLKNKSK